MNEFKFLHEKPALLIEAKQERILVIGDLHLGFEYEIYKSGISLPSKLEKIRDRILNLIMETNPNKLIIIGDVKHNIPEISWQERNEIPRLLEKLKKRVEIRITPGNHDGNLEKLAPANVKISSRKGFKFNKYYFTHGHAWPGKSITDSKYLIMSHIHPTIEFKDKLGYRSLHRCWVRGKVNKEKIKEKYNVKNVKLEKFVIVPVFNSLVSGVPVNKNKEDEEYISPIIRNNISNLKESDLYLLDGTYIGKIKDLKPESW